MRYSLALAILFACVGAASAVGAEDAAALLKTIQSPNAADVDRANAFQKIGDLAGDEAVAPLTGFLADKKWSHYARFALQKMEGETPTEALLGSLDEVQGDLKVGILCSIGRRRDPIAVARLTELLADADAQVAESAAVALGWIATPNAAAALETAFTGETDAARKAALASGLLLAGQGLVKAGNAQEAIAAFDLIRAADVPKACRVAATQHAMLARGAEGVELMVEQLKAADRQYFQTGLVAARALPGDAATKALVDILAEEAAAERQVLLILAMKDRQDKAALPAILAKLDGGSPAVRLAVIDTLGSLGDASSVGVLLSDAAGKTAEAALDALLALEGADVNEALLEAAKEPNAAAVKALGRRRAKEAVDLFFELAETDEPDSGTAREAIVALGRTVEEDRFLDLVGLLKTARGDTRRAAVQEAIHAAIIRSTNPDLCADTLGAMIPSATGADREFLFEQVRTAGGEKAVAWMRKFALGSNETLQDAATKVLGEWLSADAGPVLLEVAQGNGRFANRALGGYIRLFRQFELPEEERVAMAAKALEVVRRPNERNAAIEAMTRFPCVGTFDLALAQLNKPGSETAAAQAALTIARTVLDLDPEKGKAGLKQLIEAEVSKDVTDSAKALMGEK